MKSIAVLALFISLTTANEVISSRIVNGQTARPNQFSYQAGLRLYDGKSYSWCGGSLISKEWVITAAHCTHGVDNVIVHLGGIRLESLVKYNVTKENIIAHHGYDPEKINNDIALIKIPAVNYTDAIRPIALQKIGTTVYFGSVATVSGWGYTSGNAKSISPTLMHTDLKIIANAQCKTFYNKPNIDKSKLCANHYHGGTCFGDSGGPLVLKSPKVLIGITSFGSPMGCEFEAPNGFTRVSFYLNWIKSKTGL